MSVASNPLLYTAALGLEMYGGSNVLQTTLNPEPVSEIPNNDNGTVSFGTFQATNYFTSATVTWQASTSSFSISVSGTSTTSEQSTMYINGIFCYLDTATFQLPEPY